MPPYKKRLYIREEKSHSTSHHFTLSYYIFLTAINHWITKKTFKQDFCNISVFSLIITELTII